MPHALFLSPHLDDVAFSCGGTFAALAARGWETTLRTVFTRSVPHPTGFALACQLDKGLAPDVDYLALRRAEDDVAAAALGATHVERLDLPEAPHRGYDDAPALFGPYATRDDVAAELAARLGALDGYDLVFAPQALGAHVDHRRVRDAVIARASPALANRIAWYRDTPYAIRAPDERPHDVVARDFATASAFALDASSLAAKSDACAAYATQLAFQFGGEASMRASVDAFARAEGERAANASPCERFLTEGPPWWIARAMTGARSA